VYNGGTKQDAAAQRESSRFSVRPLSKLWKKGDSGDSQIHVHAKGIRPK
jgi:hypothetical protein